MISADNFATMKRLFSKESALRRSSLQPPYDRPMAVPIRQLESTIRLAERFPRLFLSQYVPSTNAKMLSELPLTR
jgi:DNA replicative helicase MCM subunit Mcm2 (Cdc46/Mcm family)